jgi:ATP-binding cassette subfamily C protein LapB
MDPQLERQVIQTLHNHLAQNPESTLVLVTHKPQVLSLVQRVIVMANQQVVLDGPRDQVMQQLQAMATQAQQPQQPPQTNMAPTAPTP